MAPSLRPLLAACALLLLVPRLAHGGRAGPHGGKSKGKGGDGYANPVSKNASWKFFDFVVANANVEYTSLRLMPGSSDPTDVGTIVTVRGELFDSRGEQVGTNQWVRTVVAHGLTGGDGDDGRVSYLINVYYEFGAAENGFYDDTLSVSFASERPRTGPGDYFDHDATITGGTGRFLGATGRMTISDAVWDEDEDLVVKSAKLRFEVYVPNNFPKA